MRVPVSVVILTKNEAGRIRECLESVRWADEVLVVDDNSTDETVPLAQSLGARVLRRTMDLEGRHRNWAAAQAAHEWVFSLDADERVTPELAQEITALLQGPPVYETYAIPRRNYIGDRWIRHGGWYPSAQVKLFKKSAFRWEETTVHPRAIGPAAGELTHELLHYSYRDLADFVSKLDRQTTLESEKWVADGRRMTLGKALWRSADRFWRAFVGKQGWRDGVWGFLVAVMAGCYQILSYAKYWEALLRLRHEPATSPGAQEAAETTPVLCDLIVLTWNRADLLRSCVERLLAHTPLPSRLLIVDNGSTDPEALGYLDALRRRHPRGVEVIRHPANIGIAAALNAGLARTRAPWIGLLNNDAFVTAGWLEELIAVAESDPSIGLVNPMSNQFGLAPRARETIDAVARRCRAARGRWIEQSRAEGFCVVLPRRVFERVGYWDDTLGGMFYEDADYALRARQAGFRSVVAEGAYVYHVGGATIGRDPARHERFAASAARFARKWPLAQPQRMGWILGRERGPALTPAACAIRELANAGHKLWVFGAAGQVRELPRHLQVVPVTLPRVGGSLVALWRILTKKKRFQRIVVEPGALARAVRSLTPLHRAMVEPPPVRQDSPDGVP